MSKKSEERSERREHEDTMGTCVYSSKDSKSMHKSLNGEYSLYKILLEQVMDEKDILSSNESSLYKYLHPDDKSDKEILKEFDKTYKADKAIYWYTRESCIYKMLNKALRTHDIDNIKPFAQFIRDLREQLNQEHQSFIKEQQKSIIEVYRGQFISKDELNRIKTSKNQIITMNSFLSTSTNKKKALEFATSKPPPLDTLTTILLEIQVDLKALNKPYADIKNLSAFASEEEILFMFGTMFRINEINYDEKNKLYIGKLILCSENDSDIKNITENLEKDLEGQNKFIALGNYFIHMLKYDQAQKHFEKLINDKLVNDPIELAYCYHGLGLANEKKGDYKIAIDNFNKSLDYLSKSNQPNDHPLISQCYNDLGIIYSIDSNLRISFDYFEKALNTKNNILAKTYLGLSQNHYKAKHYQIALDYLEKALQNQPEGAHSLIADIYTHMGEVYSAMKKSEKASEMFDKAMESQLKELSFDHPDISYTYNARGLMYLNNGDEENALEFINKAYQIQLKTLPNNHPDFAKTYQNFGDLYMKKGDLTKALSYYEKVVENQLKTLSPNHPSVAQTYFSIGNIYWKKENYHRASKYFYKVLNCNLEKSNLGHLSLSEVYKAFGDLYLDKYHLYSYEKYLDKAANFYNQFIKNQLDINLCENCQVNDTSRKLAEVYYKKNDFKQSLIYYNRLLDCQLQRKPLNQLAIQPIYISIGKIYLNKFYSQLNKLESKKEMNTIFTSEQHSLQQILLYFQNSLKKNTTKFSLDEIYIIIAYIYLESKDFNQALNVFQTLLNYQMQINRSPNPSIARTHFNIANICVKLGYFPSAMQNYRQSLFIFQQTDPNNYTDIKKIQHRIDDIRHYF